MIYVMSVNYRIKIPRAQNKNKNSYRILNGQIMLYNITYIGIVDIYSGISNVYRCVIMVHAVSKSSAYRYSKQITARKRIEGDICIYIFLFTHLYHSFYVLRPPSENWMNRDFKNDILIFIRWDESIFFKFYSFSLSKIYYNSLHSLPLSKYDTV